MTPAQLARVFDAAAEECRAIAAEASAERAEWVGQHGSPLGNRRHCKAVQRRVADGKADAAVVGRRHLLSQAALSEELARGPAKTTAKISAADELRAELRLVGSGT